MKSYFYHTDELSNGDKMVTKYTVKEAVIWYVLKGIFRIFALIFRAVWWILRLPFYFVFTHELPEF